MIDVFARKIVGWRVSTSMTTGCVLDALNQAICQRAPSETDKLIHHSDRGSVFGGEADKALSIVGQRLPGRRENIGVGTDKRLCNTRCLSPKSGR